MRLVDKNELDSAIRNYFIKIQGVESEDLCFIMSDFEDPYDCPWINQEYIEVVEVNSIKYEKRACKTFFAFHARAFSDEIPFRFYMFLSIDENEELDFQHENLYQIEELYEEDFE